MTTYDLENADLRALTNIKAELQQEVAIRQETLKDIDNEIARRFIDKVHSAYTAANKMDGTLTIDLPDGWKLKSVVRKSVKYDSNVLLSVASGMPWDRAQKLFKVDVKMTESLYKALDAVDPALKMKIDEGRTVTTSDPSLELIAPDA